MALHAKSPYKHFLGESYLISANSTILTQILVALSNWKHSTYVDAVTPHS